MRTVQKVKSSQPANLEKPTKSMEPSNCETVATETALNEALLALLDSRPAEPLKFYARDAANRLSGKVTPAISTDGSRADDVAYLEPLAAELEQLITAALASAAVSVREPATSAMAASLLEHAGLDPPPLSVPERMALQLREHGAVVLQKALRGRATRRAFRALVALAVERLSVPERMALQDRIYAAMVIQKAVRGRQIRDRFRQVIVEAKAAKRIQKQARARQSATADEPAMQQDALEVPTDHLAAMSEAGVAASENGAPPPALPAQLEMDENEA